MQLPLQVSFRHMKHSKPIEALIRDRAARLDTFADHIMSCRVVVEPAGKHQREGQLYAVRIDLTVPGKEIAVTHGPSTEARDIHVALRDAFDAARRQLEDYERRRRGDVKSLESMPHGRVCQLFPGEGYGFLVTPDGREIYFHCDSVLHGDFGHLAIDTEVAFVEEAGNKGPQATTVKRVGRRHLM